MFPVWLIFNFVYLALLNTSTFDFIVLSSLQWRLDANFSCRKLLKPKSLKPSNFHSANKVSAEMISLIILALQLNIHQNHFDVCKRKENHILFILPNLCQSFENYRNLKHEIALIFPNQSIINFWCISRTLAQVFDSIIINSLFQGCHY